MNAEQIRDAVDSYLASIHRDMVMMHAGYRDRTTWSEERWQHDAWLVQFFDTQRASKTGDGRYLTAPLFDADYSTGLGHRVIPPKVMSGWHYKQAKERRGVDSNYLLREFGKPTPSRAADVLYCFVLDAQASSMSFVNWCSDFGYSSDSIKALNTYQLCEQIAQKLSRAFTPPQLSHLADLVRDL